jgi:phosphopantetheinyl transferase (holo-ACP synthase)
MIGNDVVDLFLAEQESNWQRKGFLEKLFTVDEQLLILKSEDKPVLIWTMWSQKEAVYKILRQKGANRGFYPLKIECFDTEKVRFQNEVFYTTTSRKGNLLQTLAVTKRSDFKICELLSSKQELIYENEIPFYLLNGIKMHATKSHHGRFENIYFLKK